MTETAALRGVRVAVTRAEHQAGDLVARLEAQGARVLAVPTIEIVPPTDSAPMQGAIARLDTYDWVVFTSANGVRRFLQEALARGTEQATLSALRIACIGTATEAALREFGLVAALVPARFVGEALASALAEGVTAGAPRVLLPRAAEGRDVVPEGLRAAGCVVDDVAVYENRPKAGGPDEPLARALRDGALDVITFTSPSIVRSVWAMLGADAGERLDAVRIVTIGPVTSAQVQALGLRVAAEAQPHTAEGLVSAIARLMAAS